MVIVAMKSKAKKIVVEQKSGENGVRVEIMSVKVAPSTEPVDWLPHDWVGYPRQISFPW